MKVLRLIKNPGYALYVWGIRGGFRFLDDEMYLRLLYRCQFGRKLNLDNPQTYNEKLQWLKLNDRNPLYTMCVDKYEVKKYVANIIGEEHIIPTLGIWDNFDEINFDALPDQFVLKCTHDSGGIVICQDKSKLNIKAARKKINASLRKNYYWVGREWPYKDVAPKIICEKYMVDESGIELKDYKIFNFNGEPKLIQVDYDRFVDHKRNLYTTDWKYVAAAIKCPTDPTREIAKPAGLEKMLEMARVLSAGIPHVRTDFYFIGNKIYFGELTFYHGSGYEIFTPESFDREMGNWLLLQNEVEK